MAPSVETNCRSNPSKNLPSEDGIVSNNSELNFRGDDYSEKMENERPTEVGEKSKTYRTERSFYTRKEEAAAIRHKFPTKVPIIVDRFHKEASLPRLERCRFLAPQEITMSQFVTIIRNRMKLGSNQAFYLLVNNRSMLSLSKTLAEIYKDHKEKDGFLYMTYASQEVFGC